MRINVSFLSHLTVSSRRNERRKMMGRLQGAAAVATVATEHYSNIHDASIRPLPVLKSYCETLYCGEKRMRG